MTTLGNSDIQVFPLTLGGNTFGWTSDATTSEAVLDAFVDGGGNFIDTADGYSAWAPGNAGGESETIIGAWTMTRRNRDKVVIATKVSEHPQYRGLGADNIRAAADASLKRLQTDYIDVYYAHFDDETTPLEETVSAFDGLVRAGKVRAVGISNYSAERIAEWLRIAREADYTLPVALQPHYNLVKRRAFEAELEPLVDAENLAVMPYWALASGFLTGKYRTRDDLNRAARGQMAESYFSDEGLAVVAVLDEIAAAHDLEPATVALSWLRGRDSVTAPIASARVAGQLPALLASAAFDLSADERARLDEVSGRVA